MQIASRRRGNNPPLVLNKKKLPGKDIFNPITLAAYEATTYTTVK